MLNKTKDIRALRNLKTQSFIQSCNIGAGSAGFRIHYVPCTTTPEVSIYDHIFNVDAVKYFIEDIMPTLRKKISHVHFYVVGSNTPEETKALATEGVVINDFVKNPHSYSRKCLFRLFLYVTTRATKVKLAPQ